MHARRPPYTCRSLSHLWNFEAWCQPSDAVVDFLTQRLHSHCTHRQKAISCCRFCFGFSPGTGTFLFNALWFDDCDSHMQGMSYGIEFSCYLAGCFYISFGPQLARHLAPYERTASLNNA